MKEELIRKSYVTGEWEHFVPTGQGVLDHWSPGIVNNDVLINPDSFTETNYDANGIAIYYQDYTNAMLKIDATVNYYLASEYNKKYDTTITELYQPPSNAESGSAIQINPYANLKEFGRNLIKNYDMVEELKSWEVVSGNPKVIGDWREPTKEYGYFTSWDYYVNPQDVDSEFKTENRIYALNGGWNELSNESVTRLTQEIDLTNASDVIDRKINKDDIVVGNLFGWLGNTNSREFNNIDAQTQKPFAVTGKNASGIEIMPISAPIFDKIYVTLNFLNDVGTIINDYYWIDNPILLDNDSGKQSIRDVDFYVPIGTRKIKIFAEFIRVQNYTSSYGESGGTIMNGRWTNWNATEYKHLLHNYSLASFLNLRLSVENKIEDKYLNLSLTTDKHLKQNITAVDDGYPTYTQELLYLEDVAWIRQKDDYNKYSALIDRVNDIKTYLGMIDPSVIKMEINKSAWFVNRFTNDEINAVLNGGITHGVSQSFVWPKNNTVLVQTGSIGNPNVIAVPTTTRASTLTGGIPAAYNEIGFVQWEITEDEVLIRYRLKVYKYNFNYIVDDRHMQTLVNPNPVSLIFVEHMPDASPALNNTRVYKLA